jgi:hypothetical protein
MDLRYKERIVLPATPHSLARFSTQTPARRLFLLALLLILTLAMTPAAFPQSSEPVAPALATTSTAQFPESPLPGTIRGTVVDQTGVPIAGAEVTLICQDPAVRRQVLSGDDGEFSFANIPSGTFQLTVTAPGLAPQAASGTLPPGESVLLPQIILTVASATTEVRVSPVEEAEVEIKEQEKQRVLGVVPNFYVTYVRDAAPLNSRQKFELAWKSTLDPVSFGLTAAIAGAQQADNAFSGYGQGAQGYAKRFGASYADFTIGTFLGSAVLPSLLKQDPRYFYKGSGGKRARLLYAIANAVICKGDNGRWQPNYSAVGGSLAAGGLSNLYYPDNDRGARLTFENAAIAIAATAGVNVLQEFVIRKLTPATSRSGSSNP